MDRHRVQTRYGSTEQLDSTPQPEMSRDQTTIEAGPRVVISEIVPSQDSQELSAPFNSTPMLSMNPNEVPRPKRGWPTHEMERALPYEHEGMVVIPKKRRIRGALTPKIQVRWRNITIPCKYSDWLTPAILIDAIRLSPQIGQDTLSKATLTLPNNLSATLHLHATLCSQGIFAGDIVTLMTRHARIYDPYGVQHFIAYRDEDKIQAFIGALQDISPIPLLSELVVYHKGSQLETTLRVQDCNLPQEPSLHVRFRSHSGGQPHQELAWTESTPTAGNAPGETGTPSTLAIGPKGHLPRTQERIHGLGDTVTNRSLSPSQTFVKDLRGRTHVVSSLPTVSIATNLLRHSSKLLLPPLAEIYILAGSRILRVDCTELENGLDIEPHLTIMLRCKGGMKNGAIGSPRGKGRGGQRASEGSSRGMGGGQTTVEISRPPLGKVDRGRGRGFRPDARRPTLLHTPPLEDMDDISRHALITARRETLLTNTARLCQERWASSRITLDYGPPPPAADQERLPEDMSKAPEITHSPEYPANQAPALPKTKVRRATARQLKLDDQPSSPAQDINMVDHHHKAEDSWNPAGIEPPSGARLEPVGGTTPGPLKDNPDQSTRDP